MIKNISLILLLIPTMLFAQEKKKRTSLFVGTSQGITFMNKEARSNTYKSTFSTTPGYAYSCNLGLSIRSKREKGFSDISLGYRSNSNGFKGAIDPKSPSGKSSKISYDRFNFLSLEYRYSRYVPTFKNLKTFFGAGIQFGYILNRKVNLKLEDSKTKIVTKAKNISENFGANTSPTFVFSYGAEFDKWIFSSNENSKKIYQRLSFDISYDWYAFNIINSPSSAYLGLAINYKVLF